VDAQRLEMIQRPPPPLLAQWAELGAEAIVPQGFHALARHLPVQSDGDGPTQDRGRWTADHGDDLGAEHGEQPDVVIVKLRLSGGGRTWKSASRTL
jgi:hypothetical protein